MRKLHIVGMKKIIFLMAITCHLFCTAQKGSLNNCKIKVIDLIKYDNGRKNCLIKNDTIYTLITLGDTFMELLSKKDEIIKDVYTYDKTDGILKEHYQSFSGCPIGIYKEFDKNGKLLKENNLDSGYTFDIHMLYNKMLNELKIDPSKVSEQNLNIRRIFDKSDKTNKYTILLVLDEVRIRSIIIDGYSGRLIQDTIQFMAN